MPYRQNCNKTLSLHLVFLFFLYSLCNTKRVTYLFQWQHQQAGAPLASHLIRMMTDGVWAMAPIILQTHITHRNVRKASWHPGLGHFPGTTVLFSMGTDMTHAQPVRFQIKKHKAGVMQEFFFYFVPSMPFINKLSRGTAKRQLSSAL